jgi:hypothetical protein
MRDDDGFTAAEGWIDQWEAGVAAHAAQADELARRVAELAATTPTAERIALIRLAVAQTVGLDSEFGRAVIEDHG